MPHHEVGHDAVRGEQAGEREVGGEHRGLSDLGVAQVVLSPRDGVGVVGVDEDVVGERPPQERRHHPVGVGEGFGHDRIVRARSSASMFTY